MIQVIDPLDLAPTRIELTCVKCTRWKSFTGDGETGAIASAKDRGWKMSDLGVVCPRCPGGRA